MANPHAPPTSPRRPNRFLRVIAVLMVGVAIVAWVVLSRHMAATQPERATRASLAVLKSAILMYLPAERACPRQLSDLQTARPPYLNPGPLVDGWGSAFIYEPHPGANRPFSLRSPGPDRIPGTADDLDAWGMPP